MDPVLYGVAIVLAFVVPIGVALWLVLGGDDESY
jgi:hypothetical protein